MDMHGRGSRGIAKCSKSIYMSPDVYNDISTGGFVSQVL